jgi:hypothetical protein
VPVAFSLTYHVAYSDERGYAAVPCPQHATFEKARSLEMLKGLQVFDKHLDMYEGRDGFNYRERLIADCWQWGFQKSRTPRKNAQVRAVLKSRPRGRPLLNPESSRKASQSPAVVPAARTATIAANQKRMADHLRRLRIEAKSAFGQLLKHFPVGPPGALFHRRLLRVNSEEMRRRLPLRS